MVLKSDWKPGDQFTPGDANTHAAAINYATTEAEEAKGRADELSNDLASRDLVEGDDTRILREISSDDWAIPLMDQGGYVAAGVRSNGAFHALKWQPKSVPASALGDIGIAELDDDVWAIPFYDNGGSVAGGVKTDGTWWFGKVQLGPRAAAAIGTHLDSLTRTSKATWFVPGDSLSQGYDNVDGNWLLSEAWPAHLDALLPGVTIDNQSTQGYTVDEIMIRQGSLPLSFTITGGTIPASGAVGVSTTTVIGWRSGSTRNYPGALSTPSGLVPGTFTHTSGDALQFTRTTAGSAISVPGTAGFIPDTDIHRVDSMFVFIGRNDVQLSTVGAHASVVEHVVTRIREMIDYLTPSIKRCLIVGTINATTESPGSTNYNRVVGINEALKALYPGQFYDLRRYLIDRAIYDAGLTPDSTDLANMASDRLPPQIMADGIHYKKLVAPLIAARFKEQMAQREWIES